MLALQAGSAARGVEAQLAAGVRQGKVSQTEATLLQTAYILCWQLRVAMRLVTEKGGASLGQGAMSFVLREVAEADEVALAGRLSAVAQAADGVISARLGR
jgi:glutamate-ammonia-ligase adenylyltransferase